MDSNLIKQILSDENVNSACKQVYRNKGTCGIDGITVYEIDTYMKKNWTSIKEQIINRTYKPQPVQRVEIPKPNGGVRKLGIPTVIDRIIEQAITQVIGPIFDKTFSETSYGFRPGRSCQNAIIKALEYFNEGYTWIVDIDLEKFFDNVPHDKLMRLVDNVLHDGDVNSLIRRYLVAGVMVNGKYEETSVGTPQGGNLSPLLSNIMLNELDKELESRELRFVRYADDCIIATGSKKSAERVMKSIVDYIERKLGLKVNATKTQIVNPSTLKYLGYGFWTDIKDNSIKARPHQDSIVKFKRNLKRLLCRSWSIKLAERIGRLNALIRGWINYFKLGSMKTALKRIDEHLRASLRVIIWKQWKTC